MRTGLSALACIIFFSCGSSPKVPEGILPPDRMQVILRDVMTADEYAGAKFQHDSSHTQLEYFSTEYDKVFRLHKISKKEFLSSMKYYEAHPEHLKPVIDSIHKKASEEIIPAIKAAD